MSTLAPQEGAATPAATLTALWAALRLVVVDVETLLHEGTSRVIEVAVTTCRGGKITASWTQRVNPGLPVDDATYQVHGITTEELDGEPDFASVEAELSSRLRGLDGETVVFVAHSASGDVSVLRREYKLLDLRLPELPVLDTRKLARIVGLSGGSLADLTAALGITNVQAHSALGDSRATAEAVIALLVKAAEQGWTDFERLRSEAMRGRATTRTLQGPRPRNADDDEFEAAVDLPESHTAAHTVLTSSSAKALTAWASELADCAKLRCPYATDRVAAPLSANSRRLTPTLLRTHCETVLANLLEAEEVDVPAVATVLGAMRPLLRALPDRDAALRWHDTWLPRLRGLGRCDRADKTITVCPACRDGESCPLDSWAQEVAIAAVRGFPGQSLKTFLHLTGEQQGRGVLRTWLEANRRLLAEAAAWLAYSHHRARGNADAARTFTREAYLLGVREPRLMAVYASVVSSAGGPDELQRGIDVCTETFLYRDASTCTGWAELGAKRAQLLGWQERRRFRGSGEFDADGNEIPVRRHHPETPRRGRPRRFALPAVE